MRFAIFLTAVLTIAGAFLFSTVPARAQLDPTFGTNGIKETNIFQNDAPLKSFLLPGGKVLVVNASGAPPSAQYSFVVFNADGALDPAYGTNGVVDLNIPLIQPSTALIDSATRQTDGKILLVGSDNNDGLVIRFNENGTLDTTFGSGGVHRPNINQSQTDRVTSVSVQPDGKILIAGYTISAQNKLFLLRYEANGALDQGFGDGGFVIHDLPTPVNNILALQSDGKFLVPTVESASLPGRVNRFNQNGSVDSAFPQINFNIDRIRDLIIQPDDKILISDAVAKSDLLERFNYDARITRYTAEGWVDTSFGPGGSTSADVASYFDETGGRMGLLPDGQIVVSAVTNITANRSSQRGTYFSLVRFSQSGALNGKFLVAGTGGFSSAHVLIQPDNRILGVTVKSFGFNSADILMARAVSVPIRNYRFKANPFDFGSNDSFVQQDGKADVTVFRENQSNWYIKPIGNPFYFGLPGDIPIPADYIKDYGTEIAIFRPSTGMWYIGRDFTNPGQNFIALPWGRMGDIPIPFDHDGDSKADVAVFRPSEGNWYIRNSSDKSVSILRWGMTGDKPAPGDFDGDGKDDIAVFRPANGVWYILRSSDLQPMFMQFGMNGDIPVQEDYDGDGKTDIAVWRQTDGVWYIRRSSDGDFNYLQWGTPGDVPTPSDFDGDLKTDISVWRPGNRTWYIYQSSTNTSTIFPFGVNSDVPVQRRQ